MSGFSRLRRCVAALALLAAAPAGHAWGPLGHEAVAEIAARQLTPEAAAMVEDLLGDRPGPALREAASWADDLRAFEGLGITAPYHYVNFPRGSCVYVARRDCPGGRCVVSALERFTVQLREGESREARIAGLKWVLHLAADVHQPLHAGHAEDRGGNDFQVRWQGDGTNLHALLDSGLLRERRLGSVALADRLMDRLPAPEPGTVRWSREAPIRWAEESCRNVGAVYPASARIDDAYAERTLERLETRLLLAGHRLAALLNAAAAR
jgi:hypothetical protein